MERDSYQHDHIPAKPLTFKGYPVISDQVTTEGLAVVWNALHKVMQNDIPGDIVEFGCYIGTTSLFIRRLLDQSQEPTPRSFHVYDSFEGLPEKAQADKNAAGIDFVAGKLYVSKKEYLKQFHTARLEPPIIHRGWFDTLQDKDVPDDIAFAFLDGDFYASILTSLRLVWPRMHAGGIIVIDDYQRETLPGVERAIQDFMQHKPVISMHKIADMAIIEL